MKFEWVNNKREHIYNKLPERSTKHSAGYDFYAPFTVILEPNSKTHLFFTDIKVKLDKDKVLMLYPRSSLGMKGITLTNTVGIIDADYYGNKNNDGNIGFALVNNSDKQIIIQQGEKFMQGVIVKYYTTDDDTTTKERKGGFGSTNGTEKKNIIGRSNKR